MPPEKDHFTAVNAIRAVLPNGEVYRPAMSEAGAELCDGVYKWGIGPYLDGLFSQGSFGIVTSIQLSLVRKPEHIEVFTFTQKDAAKLPRLVDACREMFHDLRGPIGSVKLINRRFVESTVGAKKLGRGIRPDFAWMGFGVIYCRESMVRAVRAGIRQSIGQDTSMLVFINQGRVNAVKKLSRILPSWAREAVSQPLESFEHLLEIVNGVPKSTDLRLAFQHVPFPAGQEGVDPVREGVRMIWYAPVIPLKGEMVRQISSMITKTLDEYSFVPAMSMTTVSEKCAIGVAPIIYDPNTQREKAWRCFRELWRRGLELGCHPYRMNAGSMAELTEADSTFWSTVADLKSAIDPNGILSPGRYSRVPANATLAEERDLRLEFSL
jgi:FAD/FMN-containing dehydrogenase